MACAPSDGGGNRRRVCVSDCFDVDDAGRLGLNFSQAMNNLFVCTDDGLCYDGEYPLRVSTRDTLPGCRDQEDGTDTTDEQLCRGDDIYFVGSGPFNRSSPGPFGAETGQVTGVCSPTFDDTVNPTNSENRLEIRNDTCTPWAVEYQTSQFYGAIDDFQPFKKGYARVLGEVRHTIGGDDATPVESNWQRVFELSQSNSSEVQYADECTDCCNNLSDDSPGDDGDGNPLPSPRQRCLEQQTENTALAATLLNGVTFGAGINTTGGGHRELVDLAPGETLIVETRTRISRTCDQTVASIASRAGAITITAHPAVGCESSFDPRCGECP